MNQSRINQLNISVKKHTDCNLALRLSVSKTPGKTEMEKKRFQKWAGWLRDVVLLGGMEERPLFPFMMLIAYRHPLTVSSQPYCKCKTRQTARENTLPPIPVCRKPQHLMPHAQNNITFPSVSQFDTVHKGAHRSHNIL